MGKDDHWTPVEEVLEELYYDPDFVAEKKRLDAELEKREIEFKKKTEIIVKELRQNGFPNLKGVYYFKSSNGPYSQAIPIILKHLRLPYDDDVGEGIAGMLHSPAARKEWDAIVKILLELVETKRDIPRTLDSLCAGLAYIARNPDFEKVLELFYDTRLGDHRLAFVFPLSNSSDIRATEALKTLADHPLVKNDKDEAREYKTLLKKQIKRVEKAKRKSHR